MRMPAVPKLKMNPNVHSLLKHLLNSALFTPICYHKLKAHRGGYSQYGPYSGIYKDKPLYRNWTTTESIPIYKRSSLNDENDNYLRAGETGSVIIAFPGT